MRRENYSVYLGPDFKTRTADREDWRIGRVLVDLKKEEEVTIHWKSFKECAQPK